MSSARFKLFSPTSGRLLIREAGDGFALVGVLHFPPEFEIREAASYLLLMIDGHVEVASSMIDDGLPDEMVGNGIGSAMRGQCWTRTTVPGTLAVRFFKAFPESNGWVVFGPSQHPIVSQSHFNRSHAWFDILAGKFSSIEAPFDAVGEAIASTLTMHAVWPNAQGDLHALPGIESAWRSVYLRHVLLLASVGAGEISLDEFRKTVQEDHELFHIRQLTPDMDYARYLACLRDRGGIAAIGVTSAADLDKSRQLRNDVIRELMAGGLVMA